MSELLSLRRRRSYGSPHQAAMTSSHCSKDLIRPISYTVGLQIRPNNNSNHTRFGMPANSFLMYCKPAILVLVSSRLRR